MGAVQALAGPPHLQQKIGRSYRSYFFLLSFFTIFFRSRTCFVRSDSCAGMSTESGVGAGSGATTSWGRAGRLEAVVQHVHRVRQYLNAVNKRDDSLFEHVHRARVRTRLRHDIDQEEVHLLPGVHTYTVANVVP